MSRYKCNAIQFTEVYIESNFLNSERPMYIYMYKKLHIGKLAVIAVAVLIGK